MPVDTPASDAAEPRPDRTAAETPHQRGAARPEGAERGPRPSGNPGLVGVPRPAGATDPADGAVQDDIGPEIPVGPENSVLLESLMTGMDEAERSRLLGMISSSIEAEREAALDGRVRRRVDVGPRHRSRRRDLTDGPASVAGGAQADGTEKCGSGPDRENP